MEESCRWHQCLFPRQTNSVPLRWLASARPRFPELTDQHNRGNGRSLHGQKLFGHRQLDFLRVEMTKQTKHIPSQKADSERRLRQADRLARIMRVLQLLQSRGRWNVKSIAQELECSERTIHRDLTVLELAGVPWSYDKDQQCYRLRPDYTFPVLSLSDEEVVGLATSKSASVAPGLDINSGAIPVSEKFLAARPDATGLFDEATNLTQVLDLKLVDHSKHREVIRTIQWALVEGRQITGKYVSPHESGPVTLTLHPYRLCLVKSAWYLVARTVDAKQPITLRPTRFKSVRMIDEAAELPDEFDLFSYFGNAWAVYRGDAEYAIELRFSKRVAGSEEMAMKPHNN